MNFTREPIIETIISAKDGYKILVRSSKGTSNEEYTVDAVEVVSFGSSLFFRCLERPKCFLLPVSDYEVLEVKETRVVLKNVPLERTIKIGGGRETPKVAREPQAEKPSEEGVEEEGISKEEAAPVSESVIEQRKRDRKRHRRRRGGGGGGGGMEERGEGKEFRPPEHREPAAVPTEGTRGPQQPPSQPVFTTLFPPPPTLISETISRYKEAPFLESNILAKQAAEQPTIETFVEERKEKDIIHQELMESEVVPVTGLPEEMAESHELFVAKEKEEERHKEHPHKHHEGAFEEESP